MEAVIYVLKSCVLVFLDVFQIALLARAIMSWIDRGGQGAISGFLIYVTEPFIMPFRRMCEKNHWFEGSMLDIPFLMTVLAFMVLQTILTVL